MNIIIVGNGPSVPRSIDLETQRGRLLLAGVAIAAIVLVAGIGFALALTVASPQDSVLRELRALRGRIATDRGAIEGLRQESQRDLTALTLQLGRLQAQATRLNALGARLTEIGKLDDGEFDFSQEPGLGGPDEPAGRHAVAPAIGGEIDRLRAEFDQQESQLGVLENLLLDRKVDKALLPSGMPVAHGYIASGYGERTDPLDGESSFHSGLDIDAPADSKITSVAEGVVTFAGARAGYGNVVEVDHGNGYLTRYAHAEKLLVHAGQRVHAGEPIALVGTTGRSTGPHCHFEVWHNGKTVNPLTYVRARGTTKG